MKYLITQDLMDTLQVHTQSWLSDMLADLKPIEPLSDESIKQAAIKVAEDLWGDGDVGWTDADGMFYHGFVRAIERHIIGETE